MRSHPLCDEVVESLATPVGRLGMRGEDRVSEGVGFLAVTAPNLAQDDGAADFVLGVVVGGRNVRVHGGIDRGHQV
jgi:hypothetical protein